MHTNQTNSWVDLFLIYQLYIGIQIAAPLLVQMKIHFIIIKEYDIGGYCLSLQSAPNCVFALMFGIAISLKLITTSKQN